jgi:glycosyltransferase involved in cell wall biosynthesis
MKLKVDIWHNILWSRYKGAVFSEIHRTADYKNIDVRFFQIAETENDRYGLGDVDLSYHHYPYELITTGSLQDVSVLRLMRILAVRTFNSDADIVVIAGYHKLEYWAQLFAALLTRKKVMVFCDSTYFDQPRGQFFKDICKRVFFRCCDGFFCYGQRSKEYLLNYNVPANAIFIRCQAAALPLGYRADDALEKRLSVLRTGISPTILYVGRLAPEKNLSLLLEAFQKLSVEIPEIFLRIVGEGPERKRLEEATRRMGLSARVIFTGGMSGDRLYTEYVNAACLVLPSVSEPWGLVVNEALSSGCPVVVSERCGCVPELVLDGVTGFQFATFDVNDLKESLAKALHVSFNTEDRAYNCIALTENFTPIKAAHSVVYGLETASISR